MGNRAVISFSKSPDATGIYLHWNGGPESVMAFCHAAEKMGARNPGSDDSYAMAGLIRAVTLFMHYRPGELLSVGVGPVGTLDTDNGNNGHYIIGANWNIKERLHAHCNKMTPDDLSKTGHKDWPSEYEQYNGMQAQILERHLMILEKKQQQRDYPPAQARRESYL